MKPLIPVLVGLVAGVIFFALGIASREWVKSVFKTPCQHRWKLLIEKYPTFKQDRWDCSECGLAQNFTHDSPPVRIKSDVCNMGHVHIAGYEDYEEWPEVFAVKEQSK